MARISDAGLRQVLETIIFQSEQLRNLAKASGQDSLALALEQVLHEARAVQRGGGHDPLPKVDMVPFNR